jgi:hypothetical protein
MAYVDQGSNFGYGEKLTSVQMQNLRDNLNAAFAKDSGAPQLAADYVTSAMIADGNISSYHIANESIGATQIDDNSITGAKINAAEIDYGHIVTDAIRQAELKTSTGEVSVHEATAGGGSTTSNETLPGGEHGFYPQIKYEQASWGLAYTNYGIATITDATSNSTYTTIIQLTAYQGSHAAVVNSTAMYAQQRYVTSSGEIYWIFLLRDKKTKRIISSYAAPDHPCFGNTNNPNKIQHPFIDFNEKEQEIIVINPSSLELQRIDNLREYAYGLPTKTFMNALWSYYELDETTPVKWPTKKVTIGLNKEKSKSIKAKIPKPGYMKQAKLKKK